MTRGNLARILLAPAAIVALTGAPTIAKHGADWTDYSDASRLMDDPNCASLLDAGDRPIYQGMKWVALRGNDFTTPNDGIADDQAEVGQAATNFDGAADALAFLQHARDVWQPCADRTMTVTFREGNRGSVDFGPLRAGDQRIAVTMQQQDVSNWRCTHALAVRGNAAAEIRLCLNGKDPAPVTDEAITQMLAAV